MQDKSDSTSSYNFVNPNLQGLAVIQTTANPETTKNILLYNKCWRVFSLTGTSSEGLDTRTENDLPESSLPLKSMRKKSIITKKVYQNCLTFIGK